MELILWRHAEAEEGEPDSERALTDRGRKQAKRIADWLRPRISLPLDIFVSPAVRTQQTALALNKDFVTTSEIGVNASVNSVLKTIRWPHTGRLVIVVGHQPTLGRVAAVLLSGKEEDWVIKKGAIWWLEHRAESNETVLRACLTPALA